jgi:hypothetical protein
MRTETCVFVLQWVATEGPQKPEHLTLTGQLRSSVSQASE